MKQKLIAALLTLLALLQFPGVVFANELALKEVQEEKSEVITAYRTGSKIFAFLHFDGEFPDAGKLTLSVNEDTRLAAETLQPVWNQSPGQITLLVDTSVPMERHRDNLLLFAKNLMRNGPKDLTVSVVTVKNAEEIASGLRDWESLENVLEALSYGGWASDLCGSVAAVLERIGQDNHDNGAMLNLVVFSGGVGRYYPDDGTKNLGKRGTAADAASGAIQKHPETVVHSVCVETGNTMEQKALATGKGCQLKATDSVSAANAAMEIADYINDTWTAKFAGYDVAQLPLDNLSICYQMPEDGSTMLHNLKVGVVADLNPAPEETTPPEQEEPVPSEETDPTGETADPEETAIPEETEGETPGSEPSEQTPTGEADPEGEEPGRRGKGTLLLWAGIAMVAAAAILGILAVISARRRKSATVVMRAVVEFGTVRNLRERYYLKKPLTIGSGRGCDIVIPGASVSPKNTRIYLDNDIVYVEDLNSQRGTLIGGMRIYAPNRLRSGDVITVGNTSIRFLF